MKIILKTLTVLFGLVVLTIVGLFVAMSIANSPGYAWRVLTMMRSDTQDYKAFPNRAILNGSDISLLPRGDQGTPYEVQYRYKDGTRTEALEDLLRRTGTRTFLIVQDDQLIYETYLESSAKEINTSFSVAKSFTSALIGAAIADGYIGSVDDPLIRYIPEIAGRGLDALTIHNLLRMDTGIRYRGEDQVLAPFSDDALTYYPPDLRRVALRVQAGETPIAADFHYNNFHPLLEGMLLERATGMHVAEYLQERIWKAMGAQYPASWSIDSQAAGFEKMESGINARAVDYARFGLLYLHQGQWNGRQILPADWVTASTAPDPADERAFADYPSWKEAGGYYGFHWWGLKNADGGYDFMARSNLGQLIYVAPRSNMVIVRLGDELDSNVIWSFVARSIVDQTLSGVDAAQNP